MAQMADATLSNEGLEERQHGEGLGRVSGRVRAWVRGEEEVRGAVRLGVGLGSSDARVCRRRGSPCAHRDDEGGGDEVGVY